LPALRAGDERVARRTAGLAVWAGRLLDLVFPPRCAGCRRPGSDLCAACREEIHWQSGPACPACGRPGPATLCSACQRAPLPLDGVRSAVEFAGPVRRAVHLLKYRGRRRLAPVLAGLMIDAWPQRPLPVDLLVPVPLHPSREAARGYNQAAELARALAPALNLPCEPRALVRRRVTRPQVELSAHERRANVSDAFAADVALAGGRRVLLVDDVCTTGATLGACAQALRAAGSAGVWAYTLARAAWDPERDTTGDVLTEPV
jgi:ComF family protein